MNVLIVDGHPLVHEALGAIVRSVYGCVDLRTATSLEAAVAIVSGGPKLHLVLLDLALYGCVGIEALTRFRAACPSIPVVIVSANDNRATILSAFKSGVVGYLPKTMTPKVMTAALQLVAAGGFYVPCEVLGGESSGVNERPATEGMVVTTAHAEFGLTDRQFEVLQLIQRGYNNRRIARVLAISEGTVKQHVHAMLGVLRVSSRAEAIAAASRLGLPHE